MARATTGAPLRDGSYSVEGCDQLDPPARTGIQAFEREDRARLVGFPPRHEPVLSACFDDVTTERHATGISKTIAVGHHCRFGRFRFGWLVVMAIPDILGSRRGAISASRRDAEGQYDDRAIPWPCRADECSSAPRARPRLPSTASSS